MITPIEIEKKEFSRSVRGYDRDEVDEFLDEIIIDLQGLLKSYDALKRENDELKAENAEHKKSQKKVVDTLESAKRLMKDISDSAEKRADIIIKNAKMDAEMILNDAKSGIGGEGGSALHKKVSEFRQRYKQLLESELASLEEKSGALLSDIEVDFTPVAVDEQVLDLNALIEEPVGLPSIEASMEKIETMEEELGLTPTPSPYKPKDTVVLDSESIDKLLEELQEEPTEEKNL